MVGVGWANNQAHLPLWSALSADFPIHKAISAVFSNVFDDGDKTDAQIPK